MTERNSGNDSGTDQESPTLAEHRLVSSEYDRHIRPGDVVRDLWGGGWMIIFLRKAETVTEYDRMQDDTKKSLLEYEGNRAMGATEKDTVWQCFYLNKNNTLAGGRSGPYCFPESRICRYAYEATDGWNSGRFQDQIILDTLAKVAHAFPGFQHTDDEAATLFDAISLAFDEQMAEDAFELGDAMEPPIQSQQGTVNGDEGA